MQLSLARLKTKYAGFLFRFFFFLEFFFFSRFRIGGQRGTSLCITTALYRIQCADRNWHAGGLGSYMECPIFSSFRISRRPSTVPCSLDHHMRVARTSTCTLTVSPDPFLVYTLFESLHWRERASVPRIDVGKFLLPLRARPCESAL